MIDPIKLQMDLLIAKAQKSAPKQSDDDKKKMEFISETLEKIAEAK